jgi:hypothetical protein
MSDRSVYIIPGIVDGAVVHKQAQERQSDSRFPEGTYVHNHKKGVHCNEKCTFYPAQEVGETA